MRTLILSDLHSNLEALQAVLAATEGQYDQVVCCGDLVGYGSDPDAVVAWVRENVTEVVRGNHDKACSSITEAEDFSLVARHAALWTRRHLSPENLEYLRNLPQGPRDVMGHFTILHGSPLDEDEYVPTTSDAAVLFAHLNHRVSFFGHTHIQGGFVKGSSGFTNHVVEVPLQAYPKGVFSTRKGRGMLELRADEVYLLNPGSVGQPRDRDSRAAFAIYDTEGIVEFGRVSYDIETAMQKILKAGLPDFLAYRLNLGH